MKEKCTVFQKRIFWTLSAVLVDISMTNLYYPFQNHRYYQPGTSAMVSSSHVDSNSNSLAKMSETLAALKKLAKASRGLYFVMKLKFQQLRGRFSKEEIKKAVEEMNMLEKVAEKEKQNMLWMNICLSLYIHCCFSFQTIRLK